MKKLLVFALVLLQDRGRSGQGTELCLGLLLQ